MSKIVVQTSITRIERRAILSSAFVSFFFLLRCCVAVKLRGSPALGIWGFSPESFCRLYKIGRETVKTRPILGRLEANHSRQSGF
jgi:hypothetical protein